jgi:SEC-C motif
MNIITSGTSEAVLLAGSPPSLDAIAAAAESACRRSYAGFDDPTEDVTPHAMLSVPGGVLALPPPTNDDPLRKALLACRWLPTLIWRTRATACLLVQPAWCMFGSDGWRPGTAICDHPQRKEVVMFAGQDMSGAALRRSRSVARHADGSSSFGETALTPHKAADAGLFVRALTAAFGTFAADEAQRVFRLRWAHDDARAEAFAALDAVPTELPVSATWCRTEPTATVFPQGSGDVPAIRQVLGLTGTEDPLMPGELAQELTNEALIAPLNAAGLSGEDVRRRNDMPADMYGSLQAALRAADCGQRAGRNAPCPCGSGTKTKRCCQ